MDDEPGEPGDSCLWVLVLSKLVRKASFYRRL